MPPPRARLRAAVHYYYAAASGGIRSAASALEPMDRSAPIARTFRRPRVRVAVIRNYRDDLMARPCAPNPRASARLGFYS